MPGCSFSRVWAVAIPVKPPPTMATSTVASPWSGGLRSYGPYSASQRDSGDWGSEWVIGCTRAELIYEDSRRNATGWEAAGYARKRLPLRDTLARGRHATAGLGCARQTAGPAALVAVGVFAGDRAGAGRLPSAHEGLAALHAALELSRDRAPASARVQTGGVGRLQR